MIVNELGEPIDVGGTVFKYIDYWYITPYIIFTIAIINIILTIKKRKIKELVLSIVFAIIGIIIFYFTNENAWGTTPMLGGGGIATIYIRYELMHKILFIISIILQFIPLILALKKSKNNKKDEVNK